MADQPLPPNWEQRYDQRTGCPYFVNHATCTTHWEDPREAVSSTDSSTSNSGVEIPVRYPETNNMPNPHVDASQQLERERSPLTSNHMGSNNHNSSRPSPRPERTSNPTRKESSNLRNKPTNPALNEISLVRQNAESCHAKIESFTSVTTSKEYKYLEEMMEQNLCKLDNIEANGDENIRTLRKEAVRYIQMCLDQLELKALANETG